MVIGLGVFILLWMVCGSFEVFSGKLLGRGGMFCGELGLFNDVVGKGGGVVGVDLGSGGGLFLGLDMWVVCFVVIGLVFWFLGCYSCFG